MDVCGCPKWVQSSDFYIYFEIQCLYKNYISLSPDKKIDTVNSQISLLQVHCQFRIKNCFVETHKKHMCSKLEAGFGLCDCDGKNTLTAIRLEAASVNTIKQLKEMFLLNQDKNLLTITAVKCSLFCTKVSCWSWREMDLFNGKCGNSQTGIGVIILRRVRHRFIFWPKNESHRWLWVWTLAKTSTYACRLVCKYMDQKGSAAMLRYCYASPVTTWAESEDYNGKKAYKKGSTLALKPMAEVTRSPIQGYQ